MNNPVKPWSTHRQILWLVGVLGLLLLWGGFFVAFMLQGGFGPGSHTSPPGFADLGRVILCSFPGVYYIVVAGRAWTRRLWRIGLALHALVVVGLIASGLITAVPLVLIWAVAWILYARQNTLKTP